LRASDVEQILVRARSPPARSMRSSPALLDAFKPGLARCVQALRGERSNGGTSTLNE